MLHTTLQTADKNGHGELNFSSIFDSSREEAAARSRRGQSQIYM